MANSFPLSFQLNDGTTVQVYRPEETCFEIYLTRLNSERHNFFWRSDTGEIEESYETRFDKLQLEAVARLKALLAG